MAFVHPQSCECMKSELDIFTVPPTQTSIETGNWVEYNPIASIADGSPIEFTVSRSEQDYLDAAHTQLYVKVKITQADGADIANDAASRTRQSITTFAVFRRGCVIERNSRDLVKQHICIQNIH